MSNKAVLIIGLPGSGKTHLARTKYSNYQLIDDPSKLKENLLLLLYHLNATRWDVVITDPPLCNATHRNQCIKFLKSKGYSVKCVYFENDPSKCRRLLELRNDGRIIKTFESFQYTIPKRVKPLKIYSPK